MLYVTDERGPFLWIIAKESRPIIRMREITTDL
ncbi:hypothetical protein N787_03395 [Arenimonas metalli CF5-1]|uniref:Uncharacterized protein n=1 Tax=Arenimonas metalli CF5-1 TaxID=1384056 RepID=A0A091BE65_9GAMM|nr:hypothetical protein N787_03395 [Arenimonas metalli CF5-1]